MRKSFDIADILSISTGVLVSPGGSNVLYHVMNHMTQDDLLTHQLLVALYYMRPELIRQLPWLANIESPKGLSNEENCAAWVMPYAVEHGDWHSIESAEHLWGVHDPIQDLIDLRNGMYRV